jgi:hypothetical protein
MNHIYIDLKELPTLDHIIEHFDSETTYCPPFEVMKETGMVCLELDEYDYMVKSYQNSSLDREKHYSNWIYDNAIKKANGYLD